MRSISGIPNLVVSRFFSNWPKSGLTSPFEKVSNSCFFPESNIRRLVGFKSCANDHLALVHTSVVCSAFEKVKLATNDNRIQKHLDSVVRNYEETEAKLSESNRKNVSDLKKQLLNLKPFVELKLQLDNYETELKELNKIITDLASQEDPDFLKIAEQDKDNCVENIKRIKIAILDLLVPEDPDDIKDIIIELSAGVGGQEAMLFTKDLFDMYYRYADYKGWNSEILLYNPTDIGGLHTAHLSIGGEDVHKFLKFEGGVHRVQRVPKTERTGRIHTSTVTVAVLPQPTEVDIVLNPRDLEIEYKHASGPGGQNVNKSNSCVRVTHKPTGLSVECQMERFQHMNQKLALKGLRAKLYQMEFNKRLKEEQHCRKLMVGTAARSDKIRTYNYLQDRITDHRLQQNAYDVELFLLGESKLDEMIRNLQDWSDYVVVNEMLKKYDAEGS